MDGERLKLVVRAQQAGTARKIYTLIKSLYGLETTARSKTLRRFKKDSHFTRYMLLLIRMLSCGGSCKASVPAAPEKDTSRPISYAGTAASATYLRGMFLSKGFINRPEGEYHLEIIFQELALAKRCSAY